MATCPTWSVKWLIRRTNLVYTRSTEPQNSVGRSCSLGSTWLRPSFSNFPSLQFFLHFFSLLFSSLLFSRLLFSFLLTSLFIPFVLPPCTLLNKLFLPFFYITLNSFNLGWFRKTKLSDKIAWKIVVVAISHHHLETNLKNLAWKLVSAEILHAQQSSYQTGWKFMTIAKSFSILSTYRFFQLHFGNGTLHFRSTKDQSWVIFSCHNILRVFLKEPKLF